MARVIKQPKESEIECHKCEAGIGYTIIDIQHTKNDTRVTPGARNYDFIECPVCKAHITVKEK